MRKLFRHRMAKPVVHGLLTFGAFTIWADGGIQWLLPRYVDWAIRQAHGLPGFLALPLAVFLGVAGIAIILASIQLPVDLLTLAEHVVRTHNERRSGT